MITKTHPEGFGRNATLSHADAIIDAVKTGKISHFFLVGGCDGAKAGRNYYTEFAEEAPQDSVMLTLACGKYRFNKQDFGDCRPVSRDCWISASATMLTPQSRSQSRLPAHSIAASTICR